MKKAGVDRNKGHCLYMNKQCIKGNTREITGKKQLDPLLMKEM